jgi:tetratricopeptide (TPR) repeat protein
MQLAAITGRRFDFELLEALGDRSEREVLTALKQLIGAGLIVEESADVFTFRHALIREAVLEGLLARERRALHKRVAATLEALNRVDARWLDDRSGDLASHYAEAEEWEPALEYARRAGERALALNAPQVAVEQLTRAIQAAERLGATLDWRILWQRGHAHEIRGEFDAARVDLQSALDLARAAGDRAAEWQTLLDLGVLWSARDYSAAGEYYQAALELSRELNDPHMVARSLNRVGNFLANQGRPAEAQSHHVEALATFERLGAPVEVAQTLDLLGMAAQLEGDAGGAATHWRRAIEAFRPNDDRLGLASSLASLGILASDWYVVAQPADLQPSAALRSIEEAGSISRAIGWRPGQVYAEILRVSCLAYTGDYARALGALDQLGLAEELEHRQWTTAQQCLLGSLYLDLLDFTRGRAHFEHGLALAQDMRSHVWIGNCGAALRGR